ncbi:MAG: hypothetical protein M0R51_13935 [Clostridia bacterium]|jgi:hypothetical protein|nr:hypothetical protein [Clostridia bacterium]
MEGFTFLSSIKATIAGVDDGGDGTIIVTTLAAHGFSIGNIATLTGTTDYDGVYEILSKPSDTTFTVTKAFNVTRTGTATRGSCLVAGAYAAGYYKVYYEMSGKGAGTNQEYGFRIFKNTDIQVRCPAACKYGVIGDIIPSSGGGTLDLVSVGDMISFMLRNNSGSSDFTMKHMNLLIEKI